MWWLIGWEHDTDKYILKQVRRCILDKSILQSKIILLEVRNCSLYDETKTILILTC